MISKSKLVAKLGAVAFVAATAVASPAFAASIYSPSETGGASTGYNHHIATDYRLKHHAVKHHQPNTTKPQ